MVGGLVDGLVARSSGPDVGLLAEVFDHFGDRVMVMALVVIVLVVFVRALGRGRVRHRTIDARLRNARREFPYEAAVVEPVPLSEVATVVGLQVVRVET